MGKFVTGVVILVLLLGAGDVTARVLTQRQLEHRIETNVPGASAKVTISSFPFLGRLAASGTVGKIRARVTHVASGAFSFDAITMTVTGVRFNRNQLFQGRVKLDKIDSGTVTADLSESELDRALGGIPVKLGQGSVALTVAGARVTAQVSVVNNQLRLQSGGVPVTVDIPKLPVLPCVGSVVVTPQHVELGCTFKQIPSVLLDVSVPVKTAA
jgi:hypothetical protein